MSPSKIEADTLSIQQFLEQGAESRFIIPEYQRPYSWTLEEVHVLFQDLWDFTEKVLDSSNPRDEYYFLGSIVSFDGDDGKQIIDGQQRITSLFLLLRAIYTELDRYESKTDDTKGLMNQIKQVLWKPNRRNRDIVDFDYPLLMSKVITDDKNKVLADILRTGQTSVDAKDSYSVNYREFQKLFQNAKAERDFHKLDDFIDYLLHQVIVLPISANSQDTALTIFATLNNRGLPLSDADVFKAQIYNDLKTRQEKESFIVLWKELDDNLTEIGESMQSFFYYYMFIKRAENGQQETTTPGLRKYFNEKENRLKQESLKVLNEILKLWWVVKRKPELNDEQWVGNMEIRKALDILTNYPNDFWKYPVINYYVANHLKNGFESRFLVFLRKLIAGLLSRHLVTPFTAAVKSQIVKLNVQAYLSDEPEFAFETENISSMKKEISAPHRSAVRMLLSILAYNHPEQKDLLPENWEVEHIFPRNYKRINHSDTIERIEANIEHLGNKIALDKKTNVKGSNDFFGLKKTKYKLSPVAVARYLANNADKEKKSDWKVDDILIRDSKVESEIIQTLERWANAPWNEDGETVTVQLSKKELEMLVQLRQSCAKEI